MRNRAAHGVMIVLCGVALFPVYWMVVTSLRPANDILSGALMPGSLTLDNYAFVWREIPMARMLVNTFAMALLVTLGQLLTGLLAAYAFARWRLPGGRALFLVFVGTWLVPLQVTMLPNYVLLARLQWLNSLAALVVPQLAAAFAIILLRQHLLGFPRDLLDAACIDGASSWRTLWGIVVPNLRAPLAALAILLFISTWKEYFWPLLVTSKPEQSVVQVGLQMFASQEGDLWGPMMAASTLACLPIFALYLVLQRQVVDAFVRSGLK
jgi:ABC-type glycerol-3-phosphate transport system permease component